MIHTTPPVHLRLGVPLEQKAEKLALRAVLTASRLLGVATGTHLRHLRDTKDPLPTLHARLQEAELRAHLAWEAANILRSRFARIPEKRRPYFTPAARFRILEIKNALAWNAGDTARFFLVCPNTIFNWEAAAKPDTRTAGFPLEQTPPVRRAADVVRSLVQLMTSLGFGGVLTSSPASSPAPAGGSPHAPFAATAKTRSCRLPPPEPPSHVGPLTPSSPASPTTPG